MTGIATKVRYKRELTPGDSLMMVKRVVCLAAQSSQMLKDGNIYVLDVAMS